MLEVGAVEAGNTLGALLDRVQNGEEIVITRQGEPVARLVPNSGVLNRAEVGAAMKRIRARADEWPHESFDWESLKKDGTRTSMSKSAL